MKKVTVIDIIYRLQDIAEAYGPDQEVNDITFMNGEDGIPNKLTVYTSDAVIPVIFK